MMQLHARTARGRGPVALSATPVGPITLGLAWSAVLGLALCHGLLALAPRGRG